MNVLDENILESQRQLLKSWRLSIRQIGVEIGHKGMLDEEILPFLLTLPAPAFFTRDLGFADSKFCHQKPCLVVLNIGQYEAAHFIRRLLQHPNFNTQAKRMGLVIRITATELIVFQRHAQEEMRLLWPI